MSPPWQGQAHRVRLRGEATVRPRSDAVRRWGKTRGNARQMTCGRQPDLPPGCVLGTRGLAGNLHLSGTPKADADLLTLHQDRYPAVALGESQHFGHGLVVPFDIPINDRQPLFGFGLPGPLGKRSALLAEDGDLPGH